MGKQLISLLLIFAHSSGSETTTTFAPVEDLPGDANVFLAYDCSRPRNIKDVGYAEDPHCSPTAKVSNTRNVTYQILQEEQHHKVAGNACEVTQTRQVRYCGVYDHETTLSQANLYDVPISVPIELCRKWLRDLEYQDSNGFAYPLKANTENIISFEEAGRTYIENGEVACQGQDWKWRKEILHRMVVEIQIKLILKEESFRLSDTEVIAHVKNNRLPCVASNHGCQTPTATYIWPPSDTTCDLAVARITTGIEVTSNAGEDVYISTDNSLVRLIRREAVSKCKRVVYSTNYDGLFLYETSKPAPFDRKVAAGEVSITTYVKNRDDYLYNSITDRIEEELQGILTSDCKQRTQRLKRDFWNQHQEPGLATWLVADDVFATSAGDVVYHYHCEPVLVRAMNLGKCFQALPSTPQVPRKEEPGAPPRQFFMEPLTHRLTYLGVEVPCSSTFRPKYRNVRGDWVVATPELVPAQIPTLPKDLEANQEIFWDRPDWSTGGIYDDASMAAFENYQDFSRTVLALGATLANQVGDEWRYNSGHSLSPEQLFPELQDPTKWSQKFWSKTKSFLHTWGEAAAIVFSIFAFGRLVSTIFTLVYSVTVLKEVLGCTRRLFWTFCPNIFMLRQYRAYNRNDPEAPEPSAPVPDNTLSTTISPVSEQPTVGPAKPLSAHSIKRRAPDVPSLGSTRSSLPRHRGEGGAGYPVLIGSRWEQDEASARPDMIATQTVVDEKSKNNN